MTSLTSVQTCKKCGVALTASNGRKPHHLTVQLDYLFLGGVYCLACFGRLEQAIGEVLAEKGG